MIIPFVKLLFLLGETTPAIPEPAPVSSESTSPCERMRYDGASYTVCSFDRDEPRLRLFLNDDTGAPYGEFDAIATSLEAQDETLVFAMNAGMYHEDRSPVGLYIEDGKALASLQTGTGYGNFHLLPNGVFYLKDGTAHVRETSSYQTLAPAPDYATQSGPMLVINNEIHPKFNPDSTSFKRRNGVGVDQETGRLYFVITDGFVTFYKFASFFRDQLDCENALFLDGSISRLYDPASSRNDIGPAMGPIVGIVRPLENASH